MNLTLHHLSIMFSWRISRPKVFPRAAVDFVLQLKTLTYIIYLTYFLEEYQERNSIPRVTLAPLQPCGSAARESFLGKQQREAATTMSRRAAFGAAAGATNATQASAVAATATHCTVTRPTISGRRMPLFAISLTSRHHRSCHGVLQENKLDR